MNTTPEQTPDEAVEGFEAWEVDIEKGSGKRFLEMVSREAMSAGAQVLVCDRELVFGEDHLKSALYHAKRAMVAGTNASDSLAMETLLYASGERQLNAAIGKMSVTDGTIGAVVARLSGKFPAHSGWRRLGTEDEVRVSERLGKFGITADERKTIGDREATELVLERVAAVDVLKK